MWKIYQFTNNRTNEEYVTFVENDNDEDPADYARPGFVLHATATDINLQLLIPGEGDCYKLDR